MPGWLERKGQKKMAARVTPDKVTVAAPRQTDDHDYRATNATVMEVFRMMGWWVVATVYVGMAKPPNYSANRGDRQSTA
jgi:hypothetical protein